MLSKNILSSTNNFIKCTSLTPRLNYLYKSLNICLFDVSLRDGLQGLTKEQQQQFTLDKKQILFNNICTTYQPKNIEIGSIVSNKVLPVFNDTLDLIDYINDDNNITSQININYYPNYYVLIPNKEKLLKIINKKEIKCFSFITSVSNNFQIKNTKMSLEESDKDIMEMLYILEDKMDRTYRPLIKLYVSCVNECPIDGKINNDLIVSRLIRLNKMNVANICLSDTCGSLELEDFKYIIEKCFHYGIQSNRLSLHLHVKPGRENVIEQIIHKAFDYKIVKFDVSLLEIGGCSVTMKKEQLAKNLSYELFYNSLNNYMKYVKF
jgi:isopropylmalate/homocitrate/citramalate synthase